MDQTQFVTWLVSGGGAAVALSFAFERWGWFQKQSPRVKAWLNFGGPLVIMLAAFSYLTYVPPEAQAQLEPWFKIVYGGVAAWLANQAAHKVDPAA